MIQSLHYRLGEVVVVGGGGDVWSVGLPCACGGGGYLRYIF